MRGKMLIFAPLAIVGLLLLITLGGVVVLLLWNWLLPPLLGLPAINLWQAIGLLALCRILFGGFGFHSSGHSRIRDRISERVSQRMAERMGSMSPEERERFRQRMRERCGFDPGGPAAGEE